MRSSGICWRATYPTLQKAARRMLPDARASTAQSSELPATAKGDHPSPATRTHPNTPSTAAMN